MGIVRLMMFPVMKERIRENEEKVMTEEWFSQCRILHPLTLIISFPEDKQKNKAGLIVQAYFGFCLEMVIALEILFYQTFTGHYSRAD